MPVPQEIHSLLNRQDACSTRNTLFVEQARCLLLTRVEQARCLLLTRVEQARCLLLTRVEQA
ncbi:hypothetical protein, partial [Microcoleus sp. B9-D4]|uniref:hypothetical protein n=1 Tax=Microcoleus sp. B9-D4 TaxID=2818711 RepID=UPI002FD44C0C